VVKPHPTLPGGRGLLKYVHIISFFKIYLLIETIKNKKSPLPGEI